MRPLTKAEIITLNKILRLEANQYSLNQQLAKQIKDDDLKRQMATLILNMEQRIKKLLQFINENEILQREEDGNGE